jgi:IclR family KDG regulon transcriptional repressor
MVQRIQSVERALAMLDILAKSANAQTIPELAKTMDINRATAWRLINTLLEFELVEKDDESGRFTVGSGAFKLAASTHTNTMSRKARPVLERISALFGASAFLEIAARGELIVLDQIRMDLPEDLDLAGMQVPLNCGSVGKLYLASLSDAELEKYLSTSLDSLTEFTVTDPSELRTQVLEARISGVAYNYKEHNLEWCGISASIRARDGKFIAYLNITLPTATTTKDALTSFTPQLISAAQEITALIA